MKKYVLLAICCFVPISFAGVCTNGSLIGAYNYSISGADSGQGFHDVGRISFNGKGSASFSGINSSNGTARSVVGSGTYSISSVCTVSGNIKWTNGVVSTYWLYLDKMDSVPSVKVAYHGSVVLKNTAGYSSSGTIDRVDGKF